MPRDCRRYLNAVYNRLGFSTLNTDLRLWDLIRGYERSTPRTAVQALSLHLDDVQRITTTYGDSGNWFDVQQALTTSLGYVALLRLIELLDIKIEGIKLMMFAGRDISPSEAEVLPHATQVKGLFVHIKWRKATQAHDAWIPVACRTTITLMLHQL